MLESTARSMWILRHGNRADFIDATWRKTARYPDDTPLSPDGVQQAVETGRRLEKEEIKHIFCSPFLRTIQTAAEIARIIERPIKIEAGLSEWINPEWFSGFPRLRPLTENYRDYPEIDPHYHSRFKAVYPETADQAFFRAGHAIRELIHAYGGNLLFVGHGHSVVGMIMALVPDAENLSCPLCSLTHIRGRDDDFTIVDMADTSHLSQTEKKLRYH